MNSRQSPRLPYAFSHWSIGSKTPNLVPTTQFPNTLAAHWSSFVDCPKRLITEAPFLDEILPRPSRGPVLDACAGIGCDSIYLRKKGFTVVSNEVDSSLRNIAGENARRERTQLSFETADWREIGNAFTPRQFQAILILGNSLGLIQKETEITSSLNQMHGLLQPGGRLIIDQRNYDYILDHRTEILRGNFRYSREYIYCGSEISGRPVEIAEDLVKFGYFDQAGRLVGTLAMLPLREFRFLNVLHRAGFSLIQPYYDFQAQGKADYDFLTLVATRAAE
jgi:SAM-dependent methyltransferase